MNILKTTATAALLLTSASTFASTISFSSGLDDVCTTTGCDLTDQSFYTYVAPGDGASWIQDNNAWFNIHAEYSIYEYDFSTSSTDYSIDSLSITFDDNVIITSGTSVIFDSTTVGIIDPWTVYTDVTSLLTSTFISAGDYLTFYVDNDRGLATGVAWSGTATSVPEPSMIIALGLGLVAFGVRRRKNNDA
ncbi:PEP-CTERM sorting domain-containing protein [Psychromonas sp. PT13]|uniref:PEP-CTERM sorting domain-containing protein n=1 Tax=Psychromonas sp. PT13 TaxID=3439547 RepID=UPI003EBF6A8C